MDILKLIEEQISKIKKLDSSSFLDQIYSHLERAELYYTQGHEDEQYFNDVIYRSNQAYEGALKEAYKVLAEKTEDELNSTTLQKMERHFKTNNIFRERVLQLFENYRREWRNKSTHDYKLLFKEDEAFLALTSVTSFVHLLLKEILEKNAYTTELKKENTPDINKAIQNINLGSLSPINKLLDLLLVFSQQSQDTNFESITEAEITGMIHGFLSKSSEIFTMIREPKMIYHKDFSSPDFFIQTKTETIILEIKRHYDEHVKQTVSAQLTGFLTAFGATDGILFFIGNNNTKERVLTTTKYITEEEKIYSIHVIHPKV